MLRDGPNRAPRPMPSLEEVESTLESLSQRGLLRSDPLSSVRGLPLAVVLSVGLFLIGGVIGALILRAWGAQ